MLAASTHRDPATEHEPLIRPTVLLCALDPLAADIVTSVLWCESVTHLVATSVAASLIYAVASRPCLVAVESSLPEAESLIHSLRQDRYGDSTAIAVLSRGVARRDLGLLLAGADAVFRVPLRPESNQRLGRLLWAAMAQRTFPHR